MKKQFLFALICFVFAPNIRAQVGYNVDVLPTNIGGKAEFNRLFEQEVMYPPDALKKKLGGKVTVNFAIMTDSSVTNIKVTGSGIPDIDAEAMRLFKLYQWVPAVKKEKFVSAFWSVSFDFDPDKYSKICSKRGYTKFNYYKEFKINTTGNLQYDKNWEADTTAKIYFKPEQLPVYPRGNYKMQDFIKENLEYPHQAQTSNIQGTVILTFVIEPSGLMTNIGVAKSVGGGCDQEAIRVLQMMKWNPGINNNTLVRTQMAIPFNFILNGEFKDNSFGEQK